jgi:selenocysteine-specific elongation factor
VITKTDLVDEDWLDLVTEDVHDTLKGTALEGAPVLHRRRDDPNNIEEIREVISAKVLEAEGGREGDESDRPLKLSADRVFTIKGFGTVVTGTMQSGVLNTGDEIQVLPDGPKGRVRGLQHHGEDVESVRAGTRAAINLQGIPVEAISRGDVIARPDTLPTTHLIDAVFRSLPAHESVPGQRASLLFHVGSLQITGTLTWMEDPPLAGDEGLAQLRLEQPIGWIPGESFVARGFSAPTDRGRIVGGGRLLAPATRRHRVSDTSRPARARALAQGKTLPAIEAALVFRGASGATPRHLKHDTPLTGVEVDHALEQLKASGDVIETDGSYVALASLEPVVHKLCACLDDVHKRQPARAGVTADELRTRVRPDLSPGIFNEVLQLAMTHDQIRHEKDLYARVGFESFLSPDQAEACDRARQTITAGGLSPPNLTELPDLTELDEDRLEEAIKLLIDGGELIRIARDLVYDAKAVDELRERLVAHLRSEGTIDTSTFKSMVGASRKWTIPLFEHFDRERLTVRVGDLRKLRAP